MQIGAPLPNAVDTRTIWSAASQVPYSHRLDLDAIDQWYDDLPNRFECEPAEITARSAGSERRPTWSLRCIVDEGDWWLVITADTRSSAGEAATVVGVHHEMKAAPILAA